MAEIKLKSKKVVGAGNFECIYQCFCSPKPIKEITVTAGNLNECERLAQMECDEYCTNSFTDNKFDLNKGGCKVEGCGCPEYKDNDGTCWNLNSSGGTCNHLESDHYNI